MKTSWKQDRRSQKQFLTRTIISSVPTGKFIIYRTCQKHIYFQTLKNQFRVKMLANSARGHTVLNCVFQYLQNKRMLVVFWHF